VGYPLFFGIAPSSFVAPLTRCFAALIFHLAAVEAHSLDARLPYEHVKWVKPCSTGMEAAREREKDLSVGPTSLRVDACYVVRDHGG